MPKLDKFKKDAAAPGQIRGKQVVVDPDKQPRTVDPSLSGFAQFTIQIVTDFVGGAERNGYDKAKHRYRASYIRPPFYEVRLDAHLGLNIMQDIATAISTTQKKSAFPGSVKDFAAFTSMLLDRPGLESGGDAFDDEVVDGGRPLVPENLIAYQWVIEDLDSDFVNNKLVQRPVSPMYLAVFQLPRPGRYQVRLRAIFSDGRMGEHKDRFEFRDWFIASVGDSFASGQGNPDQIGNVSRPLGEGFCEVTTFGQFLDAVLDGAKPAMTQDPEWMEPRAHRSMKSGPARAALALQDCFGQTWAPVGVIRDPLRFDKVVFASFARTGAKFDKGLLFAQSDPDIVGAGQIEELRRTAGGRRIDALMISIGGNDAGFAGVLKDLLVEDSVFRASLLLPFDTGDDAEAREAIMKRLRAKLGVGLPPGQRGDLEILYDALRDQIDNLRENPGLGEVYISGYPIGMFTIRRQDDSIGVKACGVFTGPDLDMSPPDMRMIHEHGRLLNALIERKAAEFGWHYVPVADDFEGHGYCAPDDENYWVGAELSCKLQGDFEGTMHPNHLGHAVYGFRLAEALRAHTFRQ